MKKIILSLFVFFSLWAFSKEKYQVEIEPSTKISQSLISNYNSQIEKEIRKKNTKQEKIIHTKKIINRNSNIKKKKKKKMKGKFREDNLSKIIDMM